MDVYCGCKKCGGGADKCYGDLFPGADFKPIKSPHAAREAVVLLNNLLCGVVEPAIKQCFEKEAGNG
jgi:hypothetical protein